MIPLTSTTLAITANRLNEGREKSKTLPLLVIVTGHIDLLPHNVTKGKESARNYWQGGFSSVYNGIAALLDPPCSLSMGLRHSTMPTYKLPVWFGLVTAAKASPKAFVFATSLLYLLRTCDLLYLP